jgi:hypothetical protein
MVRMLDLAAAKGFAAQYAPGDVVGLAFIFVAVIAVVAIAVFSCADGADDKPKPKRRRSHWVGGGVVTGGGGCGGGGGGC